jgi:hypothetical protein
MSDDSTPPRDGLTQFFRDTPLGLSGFLLFLFMRGVSGFGEDIRAAYGSRGHVWFLVHVAFGVAVGCGTAWFIRAKSRSRRASSPPSAV